MKSIHIHFEDSEYKLLERRKGDLTWKEYFLSLKPKNERRAKWAEKP